MGHTIFILGTDPQQCKELREILQERISDNIVMAHREDNLPTIKESDTVIITSEEKNTGILYRRLLNKLEDQVHRAELLSDLIRLFSSAIQIDELLDRVVSRSTDVLGDTAFIVLSGDEGQIRLESAFSKDPGRLVKMLVSMVNLRGLALGQLSDVLTRRQPVVISNLQQANIPPELKPFLEKFSLVSLVAVPIQTKDIVLGAFVSLGSDPQTFNEDDVATASALADFTEIALENAGLLAELQRTAITDSLKQSIRTTDFVFRCGGDEFGAVLPGTNLEGAMRAAEKILQKVESADILRALGYNADPVTVSIGLSEYHRGSHFETLVAEADQALYASKRSSKNCARAFKA